jgi:very-short-patch-repair endonuclease
MELKCEICGFIASRKASLSQHKTACIKRQQELNKTYICKKCGKLYKLKDGWGKNFCSRKCANGHVISEKQKEKITNSLNSYFIKTLGTIEEREKIKEEKRLQRTKECPVCKKRRIRKELEMCNYCRTKTPERREHSRNLLLARIEKYKEQGIRFGQHPYSEIYWKGVFSNRNIKYKEQVIVKPYILDFILEKNGKLIDFEVDGCLHRDKIEYDNKRNLYLQNKGYIIYRTWWIGNKAYYLNKEIIKFEEFYNNL